MKRCEKCLAGRARRAVTVVVSLVAIGVGAAAGNVKVANRDRWITRWQ